MKVIKLILRIVVCFIVLLIIAIGIYAYRNLNYDTHTDKIIARAGFIEKNPNKGLRIFFLPPSMNKSFDLLSGNYDLKFGDTFYDYSWFINFNQEETLKQIKCPSVLIHTNWSYSEDGMLLAAMSGDDAQKAHSLINENVLVKIDSGHNSHDEKPEIFSKLLIDFLQRIENVN